MAVPTLGRLERVELRKAWIRESEDFTPWLAQEENLKLLGDTIGLDLDLEATERFVDPFRADIVCKDTVTDSWVLIENQLERTDHGHLGQLLTYAAGLNAVTIVWIAERFTDEHRAALDWLNSITGEQINFFGLEVELWRIADSPYAPKLNVVCRPNDWVKRAGGGKLPGGGELTDLGQFYLDYWGALMDHVRAHSKVIRPRKASPQNWKNLGLGSSQAKLQVWVNVQKHVLNVSVTLDGDNPKALFRMLEHDRDQIQTQVGERLEWSSEPNKVWSYIIASKSADPMNRADWSAQHAWMLNCLELLHKAFAPRIKALTNGDLPPHDSLPLSGE